MRLIDADALCVELLKGTIVTSDLYGMGIMSGIDYATKLLCEANTIDAEPVVRCKDCKHCMDRKTYLRCVKYGFNNGHEVKPTGFCDNGVRREDNGGHA